MKKEFKKICKPLSDLIMESQFNPKWFGIFFNPYYFARKELYKQIKKLSSNLSKKILDVGCGQKPYKNLFNFSEYIGMDIEQKGGGHSHKNEEIEVYYDGKRFPFNDNEFDSVLCSQVLEHVFEPESFIREINRILKIGGYLLITVPFIWEEHEIPYDYARYTSFGISQLFSRNGFEVISIAKTNVGSRAIIQIIIGDLQKMITTKFGYLNIFTTFFLISPLNILGLLIAKIIPGNKNIYLDNIVLTQKITNV